MYPAAFDYVRAGSVQEAIRLLQQHGENAKLLAGGHSLIPILKLRLSQAGVLIDIGRIPELKGIRRSGDQLAIGAGTTYYEIATNQEVKSACPVLAEVCSHIGDLQVRNRGTIGGSLAHNDPTADLTAVMLALGGEVDAQGPNGKRTIKADDLFVDLLTTSLEPGEVLTEVRVPVLRRGTGAAYMKHPNPASGYAVVGVAALVTLDGSGNVSTCRIGVTGAGPKAVRAEAAERVMQGGGTSEDRIGQASSQASEGIETLGDLHGSPEYRAHLVRVLTRRALTEAVNRARG